MNAYKTEKYTVETVAIALRQLLKEDIPQEYKEWAVNGINLVNRNPDADILDCPNHIFEYIGKEPMPVMSRQLKISAIVIIMAGIAKWIIKKYMNIFRKVHLPEEPYHYIRSVICIKTAIFVFRRREERNDPFARHGIEWAMDTITKCRYILD